MNSDPGAGTLFGRLKNRLSGDKNIIATWPFLCTYFGYDQLVSPRIFFYIHASKFC
ncbi:Uncharacterised protein [Chlamydia trachomatis]|nr:Uncharacterised protein [Chlamydia trachomatis]